MLGTEQFRKAPEERVVAPSINITSFSLLASLYAESMSSIYFEDLSASKKSRNVSPPRIIGE